MQNQTTMEIQPLPATPAAPEIHHAMTDLETLGTDPGCPILSIGAYGFNFDNDHYEQFYLAIKLSSCFEIGMRPSADTIGWWMGQSDQARYVFKDPQAVHIAEALDMFTLWLNSRPLTLWGNSARFDMGILEAAYKMCGKNPPWKFWKEGCYRTIKNFPKARDIKLARVGTYHNALDDAMSQALHLKAINEQLGLGL